MSAIAQRRVAGATAIMILLYLLQVALFAPNAGAEVTQTGSTEGGGETCTTGTKVEEHEGGSSDSHTVSGDFGSITWHSSGDTDTESLTALVEAGYVLEVCVKQATSTTTFEVTSEIDQNGQPLSQIVWPGDLSHFSYRVLQTPTPTFGAVLAVEKQVVNDPVVGGSSFGFIHVEGETDTVFSLGDDETKGFSYTLSDGDATVSVDVSEAAPGANWSTSVQCYADGGVGAALFETAISGVAVADLVLADGDNVLCVFTNTFTAPDFGAVLAVEKQVVNDPVVGGSSFGFIHVEGETDTVFSLGDDETKGFSYTLSDGDATVSVDVSEAAPGANWSTSVQCYADGGVGAALFETAISGVAVADLVLADGDNVLCVFTNTFTAPVTTTVTTTATTVATATTEDEDEVLGTTVTTEPDGEVLGATITTVGEVAADTLPFTGSESGDMVKLAMLALLAGALMLFAVRGPKEEEEVTDIGGWSSP